MNRRELLALTAAVSSLAAQPAAPPFTLPKLAYAYDALEPYLDAQTLEIHHRKHHQSYLDNLNQALLGLPPQPLPQLLQRLAALPEPIRTAVRNHGGGHANHSLFWQILGPGKSAPGGKLEAAIRKGFGDQAQFEVKLRAAGMGVFGSGWVWVTAAKGSLAISNSPNQDSPWLAGVTPLLGIDVWEHAYYLKYQNRRADYLAAVCQVINWDFVSQRYAEVV